MTEASKSFKEMLKQYMGAKLILSVAFAVINCLGYACAKTFSEAMWFRSCKSLAVFVLLCLISSGTIYIFFSYLFGFFDNTGVNKQAEDGFFNKKVGIRCFLVIMTARIPYLIITFPGGTCVDSSYQIKEVLGDVPYSTQQPLFSTLFLGYMVKLGGKLGSYDLGLFAYILLQTMILAAIMAYSISVLHKRGANPILKYAVLFIYSALPMYGNFSTMAVKDTYYAAFSILYVVELSQLLTEIKDSETVVRLRRIIMYVTSAFLVTLFRSNGIYVIIATGFFLIWHVIRGKGSPGGRPRLMCAILLPALLWFALMGYMKSSLNAVEDTAREKMSIPFQQTARYLRDYPDDISDEDRQAIEAVIDYKWDEIGENYDPLSADPIKNKYRQDADRNDVINYFKAWFRGLTKHPASYIDTYVNHVFGWFYVGTDNDIRYIGRLGIFSESVWGDEEVKYWIELLGDFPVFWVLQSAPVYIWMLIALSVYKLVKKDGDGYFLVAVFLFSGLAFCLLGPAFYLHPRFAFSIMFSLPYVVAYYTSGHYTDRHEEI